MDWKGREQSQNVEDRRGSRGGGGGKTPGILGIIVVLVGAYYGVDLSGLVGGSSSMGIPTQQATRLGSQQEAELDELSRVVLADTEKHGANISNNTANTTRRQPWCCMKAVRPPPAVRANQPWARFTARATKSLFGFELLRRYAHQARIGQRCRIYLRYCP